MRKFMCYHHSNTLFIRRCRDYRVKQKIDLSIGDKTPILHGTRRKIRYSNQIYIKVYSKLIKWVFSLTLLR